MQQVCKCHGVSGSCTMRSCWFKVGEFRQVGTFLKNAYRRALKFGLMANSNSVGRKKRISETFADDDTDENYVPSVDQSGDGGSDHSMPHQRLAYAAESPDYCSSNSSFGLNGTLGRVCSRRKGDEVDFDERKSCRNLCRKCGFKVKKQKKTVVSKCNCKFKWCCEVQCETCVKEESTFTCATHS